MLLNVAICMMMAIQKMEFFLKMAHSESIITYGGKREKEDPFQGLLQGKWRRPRELGGSDIHDTTTPNGTRVWTESDKLYQPVPHTTTCSNKC